MDTNAMGMGSDLSVVRVLFSLILVMGMMVLCFYWLKRRGTNLASGRRMRVLERLPLDTRRSLMLVEVDGQEVMLGVTNERISTLTVLEEKQVTDET